MYPGISFDFTKSELKVSYMLIFKIFLFKNAK